MEYIDTYICEIWNGKNGSERIIEENVWDACRILEEHGFLNGDDASISAISVGPFKIASSLEVKRRDFLGFFVEAVLPAIISKANEMTFDQTYALYFLPAIKLFISLADQCFWIKDLLQWNLLLFVKDKNEQGIYPDVSEVKGSREFWDMRTGR